MRRLFSLLNINIYKRVNQTNFKSGSVEIDNFTQNKGAGYPFGKYNNEEEVKAPSQWKTLILLASFIFVLITLSTIMINNMSDNEKHISILEDYENVHKLNLSASTNDIIKEYMNNGRYELFVDKIIKDEKVNRHISIDERFYRAVSCMKLVQFKNTNREYALIAINDLNIVIKSNSIDHKNEAIWLLATAYLAEKEIVKCYNTLDLITNEYEQDALKLKNKLRRTYDKLLGKSYSQWLEEQQ